MSAYLCTLLLLVFPVLGVARIKATGEAGKRTLEQVVRVADILPHSHNPALPQARAPVNERVMHAFATADSFSPGIEVVNRWKHLIEEADAATQQFFNLSENSIDFPTFIRCTVFRVYLVGLLGPDANLRALESAKVEQITSALCQFHQDATNSLPSDVHRFLEEWFPSAQFPNLLDSPFLPAYDIVWRYTAAAVIHCDDDHTRVSRGIMLDFRDNPKDRQFVTNTDASGGCSVETIMNEVLRLHPPIPRPRPIAPMWLPLSLTVPRVSTAHIDAPELLDEAGRVFDVTQFPEGLWIPKIAALVASNVIGRLGGVKYGLSRGSSCPDYPWDGSVIYKVVRRRAKRWSLVSYLTSVVSDSWYVVPTVKSAAIFWKSRK